MGKGDKRTRRGKTWRGSYGKTRPHKKQKKKRQKREERERGRG
jgi:30S ribosomal protein S31